LTRSSARRRRKAANAAFLDAAAALFMEVGYEAASMTAIADGSASSMPARCKK
jgi:AcrR family transcriptional regulator